MISQRTLITSEERDPVSKFMYGLKSPESRRQYPRRFKMFLDFLKIPGSSLIEQASNFICKADADARWIERSFMDFISYQLQRVANHEITESTIRNYYKATKLFCEMNDLLSVNWKKITRGLPRGKQSSNDRAPTLEEISKLIEYPDRRIKPMVYTMISSGIRLGAWDYLRWGHVKPIIDEKGELLAAKLIVYADEQDQYYSFISPEAFRTLKEWMEFRASYGERIDNNSWLMRDIWQITNVSHGSKHGLASYPKKLKINGIKRLLSHAIWEQGLRSPLKQGKKRHEWKAAHGLRKFYKTHAEQVMKPINVEITMGHNIGISASYYKPTEREVLEDYLKAVDLLTVNSDKVLLKKQVIELREKGENNEYIIKGKLQEKDEQIAKLEKKQERFEQLIQSLIDAGQLKASIRNLG